MPLNLPFIAGQSEDPKLYEILRSIGQQALKSQDFAATVPVVLTRGTQGTPLTYSLNLPNDSTKYLAGDGTWITPPGTSPLTTKGDLWGYSGTNARVPIGTDGYILTADSTQALGLKWAAAAGTGTVTAITASTGITLTPNPIVGAGTVGLTVPVVPAYGGTGTATVFTAGSVVFAGVAGVYTQDNANFFWDDAANRLGLGTTSPNALLDVRGTMRVGDDSQNNYPGDSPKFYFSTATTNVVGNWTATGAGGNGAQFTMRADGTGAGSKMANTNLLGLIGFRGRDDGGFAAISSAKIQATATEAWFTTAHGTKLEFYTTPNGSTTSAPAVTIDQSGFVGVGPAASAPASRFVVSENAAALPSPASGTVLHVGGVDSASPRVLIDAYAGTPFLTMRASGGTAASPSAVAAAASLASIGVFGRGTTAYFGSRGGILFSAAEAWTDTVQGTYMGLYTTAIGSSTNTERVRVTDSGSVGVGISAPTAERLHVYASGTAGTSPTGGPVSWTAGSTNVHDAGGGFSTSWLGQRIIETTSGNSPSYIIVAVTTTDITLNVEYGGTTGNKNYTIYAYNNVMTLGNIGNTLNNGLYMHLNGGNGSQGIMVQSTIPAGNGCAGIAVDTWNGGDAIHLGVEGPGTGTPTPFGLGIDMNRANYANYAGTGVGVLNFSDATTAGLSIGYEYVSVPGGLSPGMLFRSDGNCIWMNPASANYPTGGSETLLIRANNGTGFSGTEIYGLYSTGKTIQTGTAKASNLIASAGVTGATGGGWTLYGDVAYGATLSAAVGAAGGAAALPANPIGYIGITVAGTNYQIPIYNV